MNGRSAEAAPPVHPPPKAAAAPAARGAVVVPLHAPGAVPAAALAACDDVAPHAGPAAPRHREGAIMRSLSRRLVRAARGNGDGMTVEELIGTLGDRSFGWCIVLFALITLIPLPGGSMITSIPLILVAAQMARGLPELRLPGALMRREINRRRFQRAVMRLRPLLRPIERMVRPRHPVLFVPRNEQLIGLVLFAVALALFLPIPLSGYLPAIALFVTGIGLVERDGVVTMAGVVLGVLSVALTVAVAAAIVLGVQLLAT